MQWLYFTVIEKLYYSLNNSGRARHPILGSYKVNNRPRDIFLFYKKFTSLTIFYKNMAISSYLCCVLEVITLHLSYYSTIKVNIVIIRIRTISECLTLNTERLLINSLLNFSLVLWIFCTCILLHKNEFNSNLFKQLC